MRVTLFITSGLYPANNFTLTYRYLTVLHALANTLSLYTMPGTLLYPALSSRCSGHTPNLTMSRLHLAHRYRGDQADVFSLGAVLFTMVAGREPFPGINTDEQLRRIRRGQVPIPPWCVRICVCACARGPAPESGMLPKPYSARCAIGEMQHRGLICIGLKQSSTVWS